MSLLPATSHANPTTPFWAVAGSGGGGGGGPVDLLADINVTSLGSIAYNDTVLITTIPIPASITTNDAFLIDLQVLPIDIGISLDTGGTYPLIGNLEYVVYYTTSSPPGSWGNTSSIYSGRKSFAIDAVLSPLSVTIVAYLGDDPTDVQVILRNKIPESLVTVNDITIGRISFTKIGTGLLYSP